ncbi:MAG: hypothetical protein ABIT37_11940 [Luteolibacter sp.]
MAHTCQAPRIGDGAREMMVFDKLERRFGWLSFPGFLRFYALFHVLVFVIRFIRPEIGLMLDFDRAKIHSGEFWRVVTFFFATGAGRPTITSILFLACGVNFAFMVSDGLEGAWGVFKTSLFYYTGVILLIAVNFIYPDDLPLSGLMLFGSAFLAFATLFPKVEILLAMVLPVQVGILGIIEAVALLLMVMKTPVLLPFVIVALANYIFWVGIPAWRGTARVIEAGQRKPRFTAAKGPAGDAFHTCATCERTDVSDPGMEFRVGGDGREYCIDHLRE